MRKNLTYRIRHLPFAPGCSFKPDSIGKMIDNDGNIFFFGGYVSLHLVLSGTGDISWDGRNRKLKPGDMFCILPGTKVRYTNTPEAPWSFCWVDIDGPAAEEIAREAGFSLSEITLRNFPYKEQLKNKFEAIHSAAGRDENNPCVYAHLVFDLVSLLTKPKEQNRELISVEFEKFLQDPRNYTLNINEISASLKVDRTTLFLACRKYRHTSPVKLLIQHKIQYSKMLLKDYPNLPMSQIAAMSGFSGDTYFFNAFKRENGCTPGAWRKKMIGKISVQKQEDKPSGFS